MESSVILDGTGQAIFNILRENGRVSNREVAHLLNISEGTVRQRLKKLLDRKAIRLGPIIDSEASGYMGDEC